MKKSILNLTTTIILALLLGLILPWWSIMIAGAISAIAVPLKGFKVFFIPFMAVAVYWMVYAFTLTKGNDYILSKKIGVLLSVGDNWITVLLITGIVGGLATGIAAIFGKQLQLLVNRK